MDFEGIPGRLAVRLGADDPLVIALREAWTTTLDTVAHFEQARREHEVWRIELGLGRGSKNAVIAASPSALR